MIQWVIFYAIPVSLFLVLKRTLFNLQSALGRAKPLSIRHIIFLKVWAEWLPFLPRALTTFNMADSVTPQTVVEVCPSVETLIQRESGVSFPCPTQGCSRVFQNRPCLKMHLVKTHGVTANEGEKNLYVRGKSKCTVEKHFYCPVKYCARGQGTNRPFPRMSQLKQVRIATFKLA